MAAIDDLRRHQLFRLALCERHSLDRSRPALRASERPPITPLHTAEWTYTIAQHVFRRQMTMAEADRLHRDFDDDCAARIGQTISVPETALGVCADLGRKYGPKLGICTLDSLHVACALELNIQRFWSFDDRQRKLAKATGLDIR